MIDGIFLRGRCHYLETRSSHDHANPKSMMYQISIPTRSENWVVNARQLIEACLACRKILSVNTTRQLIERFQPELLVVSDVQENIRLYSYLLLCLQHQLPDRIKALLLEEGKIHPELFLQFHDVGTTMQENDLRLEDVDAWYEKREQELLQIALEACSEYRTPNAVPKNVTVIQEAVECLQVQAERYIGAAATPSHDVIPDLEQPPSTIQEAIVPIEESGAQDRDSAPEISSLYSRLPNFSLVKFAEQLGLSTITKPFIFFTKQSDHEEFIM